MDAPGPRDRTVDAVRPPADCRAFLAGFGRADITAFEPGLGLLGWGDHRNRALGVATRLHARALVVEDGITGRRAALVCADLCFITPLLRHGVIARLHERHASLGLDGANVMLVGTHTHSAPAGYSHHVFYALDAPGVSPLVVEAFTAGIVDAIVEAAHRLAPATLHLHEGDVPTSSAVAFNRAVFAYNANPEVRPVPRHRSDEAVDRTMRVLRADDAQGRPLGMVAWFGVHGTSVHRDNTRIHGDHKGLAALDVEAQRRALGDASFVALFPQAAAADVTPNFRYDPRRGLTVGPHADDFRNAEECAGLQAREALRIFDAARTQGRVLAGPLVAGLRWEPMVGRNVPADLTGGRRGCVTTPVRLGLGMIVATDEGPLPLHRLGWLLRAANTAHRYARHVSGTHGRWDPKHVIVEQGRTFGLPLRHPLLRLMPGGTARIYREAVAHALPVGPELAPHTLPLQVLGLGTCWIVGVPFEITTVAARRLRSTVEQALVPGHQALVTSCANDYASYVSTPEEYAHQHYEAASTLFGRWTLPAIQDAFRTLAGALVRHGHVVDTGVRPEVPTVAALEHLRFRAWAPTRSMLSP